MILNKCGIKGEKIGKKHRQAIKGEALSASEGKGSHERKSKWEVVPPIVPITAAEFPHYTATGRRCHR